MHFQLLHSSSSRSAIVGTFRPTYTSPSSCVTIIGTILWTTNSSMESQQVEQLKEWQNDHQSLQNFLQIAQTNANRVQSVSTDAPTNNPIQYVSQLLPLSTYQHPKEYDISTVKIATEFELWPNTKKTWWINCHYRSWGNLVTYKSFSAGPTHVNFLSSKPANQVLCQNFIKQNDFDRKLQLGWSPWGLGDQYLAAQQSTLPT